MLMIFARIHFKATFRQNVCKIPEKISGNPGASVGRPVGVMGGWETPTARATAGESQVRHT